MKRQVLIKKCVSLSQLLFHNVDQTSMAQEQNYLR